MGWEAGYFVWGWISDRGLRRGESRDTTLRRALTWCVLLNLPFGTIPWLPNVAAVMAAMFLAMFVASGFVVLSVGYATHAYSSDHAGLIAGAGAGSWSLLVALMMPYFGRLFDRQQYSTAFLVATVVPILGYTGWYYLRGYPIRTKSV